jgi:hypothetical protein
VDTGVVRALYVGDMLAVLQREIDTSQRTLADSE